MDTLYKRIESLCTANEMNITAMCKEAGVSRGSITDLKVGRNKTLKPSTLEKIAEYFRVSVDYLLGRTEDPVDYDNDGEALAEIPLSYVEACDGDMRRARALMLTVDADWMKENAPAPEGERPITFDDFTYAMQNEAKDLTEMDKQILLSMAKQLKDARKQKNGEAE